jgi:hypothetical protein
MHNSCLSRQSCCCHIIGEQLQVQYLKLACNFWAYPAKLCEAEIAYRTANSNPKKYTHMPVCVCTNQKDKAHSNDLNSKLRVPHLLACDMKALKIAVSSCSWSIYPSFDWWLIHNTCAMWCSPAVQGDKKHTSQKLCSSFLKFTHILLMHACM